MKSFLQIFLHYNRIFHIKYIIKMQKKNRIYNLSKTPRKYFNKLNPY